MAAPASTSLLTETDRQIVHLKRILQSAEFVRSERMCELLRFLVNKASAGETALLRERPIGIAVFGREPDWDPKLDTIVRSEVRRLRAKLDRYYEGPGQHEALRLTIPKGSYLAEWCAQGEQSQASALNSFDRDISHSVPLRTRREFRKPWSFWMSASLALCCLAAWWVARRALERGTEYEIVPFAVEAGQQFSPSISPDGKNIAFVWDGGGSNLDIYVKEVDSGALKRITEASGPDLHPTWSPDGKHLAYLQWTPSISDLVVYDFLRGQPRRVASFPSFLEGWASENLFSGCQSPTWSTDGKKVILTEAAGVTNGAGLVYVSLGSGVTQRITAPASGDEDCYPRFSPDGRTIAFVRYISHGQSDIYTVSQVGQQPKRITFDRRNIRGLSWTPDGNQIVFASNRQGSYEIRAISREGGKSVLIPSNTASASEPTVSPDGRWLAFVESTENWNIWRTKLDGSQKISLPERFIASSGKNHTPSFSPNGDALAFVSDRSGSPEIWLANPDGKVLRKITHFGGPWLGTIRWSPDSRRIVFDARPHGHSAIYTLAVDGSSGPSLLKEGNSEVRRPAWSRDGKSIYFDVQRLGNSQIFKLNLATGLTVPIAPADSLVPSESVDGKLLFFTSSKHDLWMSRSDGANPSIIPDVHPEPDLDWAVALEGVYFASGTYAGSRIKFFQNSDLKIVDCGEIAQRLAPGTPSLTISADGKWLVYVTVDYTKSDIRLRRGLLP